MRSIEKSKYIDYFLLSKAFEQHPDSASLSWAPGSLAKLHPPPDFAKIYFVFLHWHDKNLQFFTFCTTSIPESTTQALLKP
jgi:hypothetical protein